MKGALYEEGLQEIVFSMVVLNKTSIATQYCPLCTGKKE